MNLSVTLYLPTVTFIIVEIFKAVLVPCEKLHTNAF